MRVELRPWMKLDLRGKSEVMPRETEAMMMKVETINFLKR